jgi:hypothetical protein
VFIHSREKFYGLYVHSFLLHMVKCFATTPDMMIIMEVLWVIYFSHVKHITIKLLLFSLLLVTVTPAIICSRCFPSITNWFHYVRDEVHTAATVKSSVFWELMLHSLVEVSRYFGWTYCMHFQGQRVSQVTSIVMLCLQLVQHTLQLWRWVR